MPVTVIINDLTLCHKSSSGTGIATVPDVCKTPSPGGPIPLPYPNIAVSADLAKGTSTITADGGNMCANKGSELSRSTGDEAGTAGGVMSSTFTKEATWMLYSFDVMLEGKNACRLTDKLFMNHQNTVCMSGWQQEYKKAKKQDKSLTECDYLRDWIDNRVNAEGKNNITGDRGLKQRYKHNTEGGSLGNAGHPEYPGPPLAYDIATRQPSLRGPNGWETHNDEFRKTKELLRRELKDYLDRKCDKEGAASIRTKREDQFVKDAEKWRDTPEPTLNDWKRCGGPALKPE